jgi:hypothetical protein
MKSQSSITTLKSLSILFFVLYALNICLSGCNKNKLPKPLNATQPSVYFYLVNDNGKVQGFDSVNVDPVFNRTFSFFYLLNNSIQTDTVLLPEIHISGVASKQDRPINLVALDSSTAVAGTHYKIIGNSMPAGAYSTRFKLVLYRTPDLDTKTVKLFLKILPNSSFPAITRDTVTSGIGFYTQNNFSIQFTSQLIQSPYWDDVSYRFGLWSKVKYLFIYDNTGSYLGVTANNTDEQNNLYNTYLKASSALNTYNAAHPTDSLKDENGHTVHLQTGLY